MYFYKALLAVLLIGYSFSVHSEFYVGAGHPHQQYQQSQIGQSLLAGIASNTIPGAAVAYAAYSFIRFVFGINKKPQKIQEPVPVQAPSYYYPGHGNSRSDVACAYPHYQQPAASPVHIPAEPVKSADIYEAKKLHLKKWFEQQTLDLAAYDVECKNELDDYYLAAGHYNRLKKRSEALNAYKQLPCYSAINYTVSKNTFRLLHEKKITVADYRVCYGNQLQQALHAEVVDIITQTAAIYYAQSSVQELPLTQLLIDVTDLGRACNQAGSVIKALTTLDACWHLLDCIQAVAEGVVQGTQKTLQAVSDPVKFVGDMLHGITAIATHIALVVLEVGDIGITFCSDKQQGQDKFDKAYAKISTVCEAIRTKLQSMPAHELIKESSSFVTECYLSGKALTAVGNFYNKAKDCATRLPSLFAEGIQDWSRVVTTPEGFTTRIADKTATMLKMSAENAFTGRVVKSASQICPEFPNIIDIEKRVECLNKLFDCPKNIFAEIKDVQQLRFNFEHLFSIEVIEKYQKGICVKKTLSGFHHDYMGRLEAGGVFVKEIVKTGIAGAYEAKINMDGTWFKSKTFFPQNWNDEKIVQKILESFLNVTQNPIIQANKNWQVVGLTSEGLEIKTIIDQSGKIITSYPYFGPL